MVATRKRLHYPDVRSSIKHGDLLLFQGRGPLSRFIRWGGGGRYSHCGIVAWEHERLMVYHAVVHGVRHLPASRCVRRYNGRVDWWALTDEREVDRDGIVAHAQQHVGKPFAILGMLGLMWRVARGQYRDTDDDHDSPPAMFCSWYVSHCYREGGGLDLVPDIADHCTSPTMIEKSPFLQHRGTLFRGPP